MRRVFLAFMSLVLLNSTVLAAPLHTEVGDAGQTTGSFQLVDGDGIGPVTTITGTIGSGGDADIYKIFIDDPAGFSAQTSGGLDLQLFLFDLAGNGIQGNDDFGPGLEARLGAAIPGLTTAGYYLLAVSQFDNDPLDSTASLIFQSSPFNPQYGPFPLAGPLNSWSGNGFGADQYTITLTGVTHTPEPATMIVWATVGGIGMTFGAIRRRRKAKAAE